MTVEIPVFALRKLCDPLAYPPWEGGHEVSVGAVLRCIVDKDFEPLPIPSLSTRHPARIAYLVEFGWGDPISVDVGVPCVGYTPEYPLTDGCHRLAAAIYRGDTCILAEISGQDSYAQKLFGGTNSALAIARFKRPPVQLIAHKYSSERRK